MKIAIAIFMMLHGVVHLLGPARAFGLADISQSDFPISKSMGILWLLTFCILLIAGILTIINLYPWWKLALTGTLLSQLLIIRFWKEAKFGTLANLLIILGIFFFM